MMQSAPAQTVGSVEPKPGKASLNQTYQKIFSFQTVSSKYNGEFGDFIFLH